MESTGRKMSVFRKQSTQAYTTRKTSVNEPPKVFSKHKQKKLSQQPPQSIPIVKKRRNMTEQITDVLNDGGMDTVVIKENKHCMFSDTNQNEDMDESYMYSPLKGNISNASSYHRNKKVDDEEPSL